jgi:GNAT superfamily N-acetyltransferase
VEIVLHDPADVTGFARLVRPLLDADPMSHTVTITVLDGLVRRGEPAEVLLSLHEGAGLVGAALRTPGGPLLVSAVPVAHATAVDAALATADPLLPGVAGPTGPAEALAAAHIARTGDGRRLRIALRLFTLGQLTPPVGVRGVARRAGPADVELLAAWRVAFEVEEDSPRTQPGTSVEIVAAAIGTGAGELLWEADGTAVSQAAARPVVAGMSRIGPVYTPPRHRRNGYAAAATAAAARWALDEGARTVLLFTDRSNATTNALYPRIGFVPVQDAVELLFIRNAQAIA